jgi:hypothetical protein
VQSSRGREWSPCDTKRESKRAEVYYAAQFIAGPFLPCWKPAAQPNPQERRFSERERRWALTLLESKRESKRHNRRERWAPLNLRRFRRLQLLCLVVGPLRRRRADGEQRFSCTWRERFVLLLVRDLLGRIGPGRSCRGLLCAIFWRLNPNSIVAWLPSGFSVLRGALVVQFIHQNVRLCSSWSACKVNLFCVPNKLWAPWPR